MVLNGCEGCHGCDRTRVVVVSACHVPIITSHETYHMTETEQGLLSMHGGIPPHVGVVCLLAYVHGAHRRHANTKWSDSAVRVQGWDRNGTGMGQGWGRDGEEMV